MLPFDETVVALLLPFAAGAAADKTALVATAGLFVRPAIDVELSKLGCMLGAIAVGAVAVAGCGKPTGNDAVGAVTGPKLFSAVPFVIDD